MIFAQTDPEENPARNKKHKPRQRKQSKMPVIGMSDEIQKGIVLEAGNGNQIGKDP